MELARGIDKRPFETTVVTHYDGGAFAQECAAIPGIRIHSLGKRGPSDVARFVVRAVRFARELRPDVAYGFGEGGGLVALALAKTAGGRSIWSIRNSDPKLAHHGLRTRIRPYLALQAAHLVDRLVYNSRAGRRAYTMRGYPDAKAVVIPNGFDADRYRMDREAGVAARRARGYQTAGRWSAWWVGYVRGRTTQPSSARPS